MFFRNRFNAMLSGGRANERRIGKLRLRAVMAMVLIIGGFTGVIVSCNFGEAVAGNRNWGDRIGSLDSHSLRPAAPF